jgi:uncharacterized protein
MIGVVHAFFLLWGDILFRYAALGYALLLFRRRSSRTLLVWAGILIFILPVLVETVPIV